MTSILQKACLVTCANVQMQTIEKRESHEAEYRLFKGTVPNSYIVQFLFIAKL